MLDEFTRRQALELVAALAASGPQTGTKNLTTKGEHHTHATEPTLNRFATSIIGAEITGMYITEGGRFFFNVQHPDANLDDTDEPGIIGSVVGLDMHDLPDDFPSVQIPPGDDDDYSKSGDGQPEPYDTMVQTALGAYQSIIKGGTDIGQGERLGIPTTPDGTELTRGTNPDYNGFIPIRSQRGREADGATEGYLFTNWEDFPGLMTRLHITSSGTGPWKVLSAQNIDFRPVHGTMFNCFGTVTPWNTPLSSEENYTDDTAQWNNPNWDGFPSATDVAKIAQYLGYESNKNGIYDENWPNPYRYGYIIGTCLARGLNGRHGVSA